MPLLGGLLVNLFGGVVAWFSQWVTRKVAFGLTAVSMMSGLSLSLFLLLRSSLSVLNLGFTGMPGMLIEAFQIAIPPVAVMCVSTYITVWTACTAYKWQRDLVHLAMKA